MRSDFGIKRIWLHCVLAASSTHLFVQHAAREPKLRQLLREQGAAPKRKRRAAASAAATAPRSTAFTGRDAGLTLFHALGKLLYNKRLDGAEAGASQPLTGPSQGPDLSSQGPYGSRTTELHSQAYPPIPAPTSATPPCSTANHPAAAAQAAPSPGRSSPAPSSAQLPTSAPLQPDPLAQGTGIFSQDSSGDECGGSAVAAPPLFPGSFDMGTPATRHPASRPEVRPAHQHQTANQAADVIDLTDDGPDEALGAVSGSLVTDDGTALPRIQIAPRWSSSASHSQPRRLLT